MNYKIAVLWLVWGYLENSYFGWNWTPKNDAELICDGIGVLIIALAFIGGN